MRASAWIVVAGGVGLLLALLYAFDVLGPGDGAPGAPDERGGGRDATRAEGGVALEGAAREAGSDADPAGTGPPDPVALAFEASRAGGSRPGGARLAGRVVRHGDGLPVPGATVRLLRPAPIAFWLKVPATGRHDLLEVRSAPDGTFAFADVLPARGYRVRAHLAGLAPATSPDLDLFAGESRTAPDLVLTPGARLSGRVVDPLGQPVAGAEVVVTWEIRSALQVVLTDLDAVPEVEQRARTDAAGRFALEGIEPGTKTLLARAPTGAEGGRARVAVVPGEPNEIGDVALPGPGVVAGIVAWADGRPIAGARVFAAPRFEPLVRSVATGADGGFRFGWLPAGDHLVLGVLVPGMPVHLEEGVSPGSEAVRIEFPLPGRIRGRVVRAADGAPIERFEVDARLTRFEHPMLGFVMTSVYQALGPTPVESPDGRFELGPLAPGAYRLRVAAPGLAPAQVEPVVVEGGVTAEARVELGSGTTARGGVERAGGTPLEGARVFVLPAGRLAADADPDDVEREVRARLPDATTDAQGGFTLPMQTPGRYDLVATHDSALPGVLRGVDLRGASVEGLRLALGAAGRLAVHVTTPARTPAAGQQVIVLYAEGERVEGTTDAEGTLALGPLPIGRCLVRAATRDRGRTLMEAWFQPRSPGGRSAYEALVREGGEVQVLDGETTVVHLEAPRRVRVGFAVRADGSAAKAPGHCFVGAPEVSWWKGVALEQGRGEVLLEPGDYHLYFWDEDGNPSRHEVNVPDLDEHRLEVDLPAGRWR